MIAPPASSAGLIAATIMDAVTKRFPLHNTPQFFPIPSPTSLESSKQMEDKSVLVFGCGELSVQLIRSLGLMRVKLVTVLCQTEDKARTVQQLADSLVWKSTKIVTEVLSKVRICPVS